MGHAFDVQSAGRDVRRGKDRKLTRLLVLVRIRTRSPFSRLRGPRSSENFSRRSTLGARRQPADEVRPVRVIPEDGPPR
jgi:hypothetical protein